MAKATLSDPKPTVTLELSYDEAVHVARALGRILPSALTNIPGTDSTLNLLVHAALNDVLHLKHPGLVPNLVAKY